MVATVQIVASPICRFPIIVELLSPKVVKKIPKIERMVEADGTVVEKEATKQITKEDGTVETVPEFDEEQVL